MSTHTMMTKYQLRLLLWIILTSLILTGMLTTEPLLTWKAIQVTLSPLLYTISLKNFVCDGASLSISHAGDTGLPSSPLEIHLQNVLVVPDLKKNLISVVSLLKMTLVFLNLTLLDSNQGTGHGKDPCNKEYKGWPVLVGLTQPNCYCSVLQSLQRKLQKKLGKLDCVIPNQRFCDFLASFIP